MAELLSPTRLQVALDLYDLGEQLLRQKLRRQQPELSPSDIEQRVEAWRLQRPGAEHGDGEGRVVPWPRR